MISSTKFISKCLDSGRSATPQRMLIIDELDTSKKNLSAYELLGILNDKGHSFNISTIYRVLDFWIEMGVVHKMDSSNNCKSVEESCQVSAQLSLPKSNKFRVNGGQVIEFHGFCKNCR